MRQTLAPTVAVLFAGVLLAPAAARADAANLTYAAYAAGLTIFKLATALSLDPHDYRVAIAGRTAGPLGVFYAASWTSVAQGVWTEDGIAPQSYQSGGTWDGDRRLVRLDYAGHDPAVAALVPTDDGVHEPVDAALTRDTIDALSAMAQLIHQVAATGRCEGEQRIFDGRRLSQVSVRTAGYQTLPPTDRSSWHGTALRCDFDGQLLAGFDRHQSAASARRPQHGSAWLASLAPGAPPVPVRVSFHTRLIGDATLYLTGSFAGPDVPAPAQIP